MGDKIPCRCGHNKDKHWFSHNKFVSCHYGLREKTPDNMAYCPCYEFVEDNLKYLEIKLREKENEL